MNHRGPLARGGWWIRASFALLGIWGLGAALVEIWLQLTSPGHPLPPSFEARATPREPWLGFPDRLGRGDTLGSVLHRNGLSAGDVHQVAQALEAHLDFRQLQAGDELEVAYGPDGRAVSVLLQRGPLETYLASRGDEGWRGERVAVRLEQREVARHGVLRGSLFASMEAMGETAALTSAFAEVFAWDLDFYTESQEGDRFSLLVEKIYREGEFAGYGPLRAARYQSGGTELAAFFFEDPGGIKGYYDVQGRSMRKAFLRAPLEFRRVSSRFSYSRLHPIHRRRHPHLGVDYAASAGTPVHSVADGAVAALSREGGGGNTVTVRHGMGYQSKYLHLSRFASGLRPGKRVRQREVIGYVGSSGLATGPHLDFRLTRHGRPVNPLKEIFPPGPPVPAARLADFERQVSLLSERMDAPASGVRQGEP